MEIDSIKMILSFTQKVVRTFQDLLRSHSITSLELIKVVGLLSPTLQAVTAIKIQLRFFR